MRSRQGFIETYMKRAAEMQEAPIEQTREQLMGLEGICSQAYWNSISKVVPEELGFKDRSGRYATDPVNALLNYGYALLEGEAWRAVHYAGLDPYGGFLHVDRPGRPSMVLDIMEEFRQQIIDKAILTLVARKEISPSAFTIEEGVCRMNDVVRKTLLKLVLGKFEDYVRHREERRRWTDIILLQARDIAKYLRGESAKYEGFFFRW